ncbi:hypothetical protein M2333_002851 [Sphingobium sp. B11D3B]|uniref:PAS domain-containing protein n=1 Tax=Sphingobium sp. B11D3B TaxID=2940575 RepID=UPI002227124A|nr:hypothetical protein [Sphingobium sp. B11D3B]MCW2389805.1 hypothetical protein [Sphingobium sp. B11D3B]
MDVHHSQADAVTTLDEAMDAPPLVRFDERRMHIRAYNYWSSLLRDRSLPSIEDLNPEELQDFGSHSVLLDFTAGVEDPTIAFIGPALAAQCDIDTSVRRASQVPARTLLSRLTDHYLQIVANAAPIGFEAEFTNQRGVEVMYRGIMMPFSTRDDAIDFVYGVINWKEVATDALTESIIAQAEAAAPVRVRTTDATAIWADGPSAQRIAAASVTDFAEDVPTDDALDLTGETITLPDQDTALADMLALARDAAMAAHAQEGRTRHALYRAVGLAHALAQVAAARPEDYVALLADSGIAVQPRSPLTALVKLVFGTHYDKTRLAEFVCAIQFALDARMQPGALIAHLHATVGGLKGVVAQVRAARRNETPQEPHKAIVRSRRVLKQAPALPADQLAVDAEGLAVVIMRREADGSLAMVAALDGADQLAERVLTKAAKALPAS